MTPRQSTLLRDEALNLLDGRGMILDLARELSQLMRREGISGAIIGGIAVLLQGYVRTTEDIDVFIDQPLAPLRDLLIEEGFQFDKARRDFVRYGVPMQFVMRDLLARPPRKTVEIEGIITVSLADLIGMKLESGRKNILRAQDLADVVNLIRHHGLESDFAHHLDKSLRPTYRKLIKAIRDAGKGEVNLSGKYRAGNQ
jgi:hypothetical protein